MKFRDSMNRFFQDRYGMDRLNRFLMILFWIFWLLFLITDLFWIDTAAMVLGVLAVFRMLSRNFEKRRAENQKFTEITSAFWSWLSNLKNPSRKSSAYKIFICPNCQQKLRVPKGKGRIRITCPRCQDEFINRS
ncbi:MAG: hypothetical protein IJ496_01030 [Ruminococcus sp.]|nr:hypothetical protein [Ruminococcus sp.]